MIRFLPLLFLAAVVLEIASIIWVGGLIGIAPTLLCMVLGGIVGNAAYWYLYLRQPLTAPSSTRTTHA